MPRYVIERNFPGGLGLAPNEKGRPAFEAVAALRARGFKIRGLEEGYPAWKAAGLPVETAAIS